MYGNITPLYPLEDLLIYTNVKADFLQKRVLQSITLLQHLVALVHLSFALSLSDTGKILGCSQCIAN